MSTRSRAPAVVFAAFAFTYFFAALLRAVTATLAPVFTAELGLQAGDLGLLAGAFFFGFAATQLPLGRALDRVGPRRTLLTMLSLAVLGCCAFALAPNLAALIVARGLIGAGLGACLMAALTCFRQHYTPAAQQRANAWMLMTGSFGMVASTVPVQWLLPGLGWRGLFWVLAALLLLAMAGLAWLVPRDADRAAGPGQDAAPGQGPGGGPGARLGGYGDIVRHPLFRQLAPSAFVTYGGLIAMQTLWAGPWLTRVCGWTIDAAARGLLVINLAMLGTFMLWGAVMPRLMRAGVSVLALMRWGLAASLVLLLVNLQLGAAATALHWAAWCVATSFISLSQPAVGAAFAPQQAGRALSAFNLVIFSGVFCVQWGLGLLIDALRARGLDDDAAFRCAFAAYAFCSAVAYGWLLGVGRGAIHNRQ
jgi:predicted MFS family arabinose efflux permease